MICTCMVLLMMTISRMTLYVSMVSSARPLPCNCSLQLTRAFFLMVIHLVTTRGARGAVNRGPPVGSMLLTERNRELTHVFGQYAVMDSLTGLNSTTPCGRDLPLHCRLWKSTLAFLSGNFRLFLEEKNFFLVDTGRKTDTILFLQAIYSRANTCCI